MFFFNFQPWLVEGDGKKPSPADDYDDEGEDEEEYDYNYGDEDYYIEKMKKKRNVRKTAKHQLPL